MKIYYCEQFPQQMSQHCLAYLLLERGIALEYPELPRREIRYGKDRFGKPFLQDYPVIQFNISHCRSCVACVIGEDMVGIDVERRFPWKENLARRICHPREWDWLEEVKEDKVKQEERLNLLWARKESYLKCIGTGIRSDLREINVLEKQTGKENCFCFQELQKPEFTLTVCSRENGRAPLVKIDWQDLQK